mmetsp:Transcript_32946/g.33255  ORF Transcript_32946/g.33255 Transcript_32946/m.33255 type:complete len:92 (-) Transcript_32946:540-815(-)
MELLPVEFPPIDTADLCAFKSDDDMQDLLREKASCASRVVIIVRLLGRGVPGFQHLLDYCHNPKPAFSSTQTLTNQHKNHPLFDCGERRPR